MRRSRLALPVLLAAALLIGCGSSSDSEAVKPDPAAPETTAAARAPGAVAVEIKDFKFTPAKVQVEAGKAITWTNADGAPHDAKGAGVFDTDTLQQGDTKTVTFDKPGTYDYICSLHPFMRATVTVR